MKSKKLLLAVLSFLALPAFAQNQSQFEDVALLISSTPNIVDGGYHQECSDVQVQNSQSRGNNTGGAIVGAVVGGLLGNTVGGGDGRKVAIGVGAATGAIVGGNSGDKNQGSQVQRTCRNVSNPSFIQGYRIVYQYAGKQLTAIVNREPATDNGYFRIRVATNF